MGVEDVRGVDQTVPVLDIGVSSLWKVDPHRGQFREN